MTTGIASAGNNFFTSWCFIEITRRQVIKNTIVKTIQWIFFNTIRIHFKLIKEKLNAFKSEHKGDRKIECYLPVELYNLIKEGKIKMKLYGTDEKWIGLTNPDDEGILRDYLKKN